MFNESTGFRLSAEAGGPLQAEVTGPDHESVAAFVLTIRFFLQDQDKISFRKIADVYDAPSTPAGLAADYRQVREAINDFLDGPSMFNINGQLVTRRDLMEVFLYGGLSHANESKRATYEAWRASPLPIFPMMENEFVATLATVCMCVRQVQEMNVALLEAADA